MNERWREWRIAAKKSRKIPKPKIKDKISLNNGNCEFMVAIVIINITYKVIATMLGSRVVTNFE